MSRSISDLQPTTRRKALKLALSVARDPLFREKKRSIRIYDTLRTLDEQIENVALGKSFTLDSYHLLGLAMDAGIVTKKGSKALIFHWDDAELFKRYAELGVDAGFRSLGVTHNWDWVHLEEPQIFQGYEPHCFAYVTVNALQKTQRKFRVMTKDQCYSIAKSIQESISDKKLPIGAESALKVAKEVGYIPGYESHEIRDLSREDIYNMVKSRMIISQRRRV